MLGRYFIYIYFVDIFLRYYRNIIYRHRRKFRTKLVIFAYKIFLRGPFRKQTRNYTSYGIRNYSFPSDFIFLSSKSLFLSAEFNPREWRAPARGRGSRMTTDQTMAAMRRTSRDSARSSRNSAVRTTGLGLKCPIPPWICFALIRIATIGGRGRRRRRQLKTIRSEPTFGCRVSSWKISKRRR